MLGQNLTVCDQSAKTMQKQNKMHAEYRLFVRKIEMQPNAKTQ